MPETTLISALEHVAGVLGSSEYVGSEVFIIIPHILLEQEAARRKYLEDFGRICSFSLANEPGTKKFCAFQSHNKEGHNEIWALEHFDSETALVEHRRAPPVTDMFSWLMETKPNGRHPLPMPVPLQLPIGSLVRPEVKEVHNPFIVITQIKARTNSCRVLEAAILAFGRKAKDQRDILLFMPGKTEDDGWVVIAAYTTKLYYDESGFSEDKVGGAVESWNESFAEFKVGFLCRPGSCAPGLA
ncbi:hypothetical protein ACN47E_001558 [Coniothyrium glycines]